jgi:invasion protein IalB
LAAAAALITLTASAGFAQDTGSTGEAPPTPPLDLGERVTEADRPLGQRYLKEEYGDWDLACVATEQETDPCSLLQILTDPNGQPMAEFTMFRLASGQAKAAATVIVPLETLLPAQLTISIGDNLGKRYAYQFCTPVGCVAQIGLTEEDIEMMKASDEAVITLVPAPAPDQRLNLTLSLKGFTAGFDVVDTVAN